jgi:hypothetical protein
MKSLGTLCWFPQKQYEVQVYYDVPKLRYQVSIYKRSKDNQADPDGLIEQTFVYLSKPANTVVSLIEKTRTLPSD